MVNESGGKKSSDAKQETPEKKPTNAAEARESVRSLVWDAAGDIAKGLVKAATDGQLATAKYLFEVAGVYPTTEETRPQENSLAYILLKRLGLPTEPKDEAGSKPAGARSDAEDSDTADALSEQGDIETGPTEQRWAAVPTLVSPQPELHPWASSRLSSTEDAVE